MRQRIYRALLRFYPAAFREEYGRQMELAFAQQSQPLSQAVTDLITVAPREHFHVILQDLRHTFRSMAARPGFTAVALASLALGIGANTAIFSLWYDITQAPLPLVQSPEQLVILTNPAETGQWNGDQGGERSWLSYPEFESMRDQLEGVTGVMATQSYLEDWRAKIQGGDWESVHGHFVSGGYFDLLGVTPFMGHAFSAADDRQARAEAVISYKYWTRRFGGRPDVLGQTIEFRKLPVTIVGVMPRGFVGEVALQQPEIWMPARIQPLVMQLPNLLQDGPPNDGTPRKYMWLHVFARRKPGVTIEQVQSRVDALFQAEMLRSYGKPVDQRLVVHEGSRGISSARNEFSGSVAGMLGAAGILLLIACANIANLLLARGAARRSEFAIRIAQGASRGRLVRQLVTESFVLASMGAALGLGLAYVIHGALVAGIARASEDFALDFNVTWITFAFTLAVTLTATLLAGVIPAWRVTRVDAQESLRDNSRSATASPGKTRFARGLVALQLALALPLLAAAGLLVATVQNWAHADLGYRTQGLVQVMIDQQDTGYSEDREAALRRRLLAEMTRIPGVQSVSHSENGFFTGGRSNHTVKVEGYAPPSKGDSSSRLDVVATNFFETLDVRPLAGRTFLDTDRANAPRVIVIDDSFAKRYFAGRDPIGPRVTAGRGVSQQTFQVVGVVPNIATQGDTIKQPSPPHYYVPAEQRGADGLGLNFVLRASGDAASVLTAARQIVQREDPSLPVRMHTVEKAMEPLTAQVRTVRALAVAFGSVALLLAAIGLYGVLAYGVARRRGEIGIRIALGAARGKVVGLILRESAVVVVGGLLLGLGPAFAVSKLVRAEFAEFAPRDATMLAASAAVLLIVGFAAAYLPARRASRLDPMIALRQE